MSYFSGPRMVRVLPNGVTAHEITDSGGVLYFADGTRTSWRYESKRLTCPDWMPWHLIDWGKADPHDKN